MKHSFEEPDALGRLNDDEEAHDEANMIRASAEGTRPEDYDEALKVIEELKIAAENESTYEKVADKILRGVDRAVLEYMHRTHLLVNGIYHFITMTGPDSFSRELRERYHEALQESRTRYQDAEKKLKDLKKIGRKAGEIEGQ